MLEASLNNKKKKILTQWQIRYLANLVGLCLVGNPSSDTALACYQVQGHGAAYQM